MAITLRTLQEERAALIAAIAAAEPAKAKLRSGPEQHRRSDTTTRSDLQRVRYTTGPTSRRGGVVSTEHHDLEIVTDFLGGRYIAECSCGWASGPKANTSLAQYAWDNHCDQVFYEATMQGLEETT